VVSERARREIEFGRNLAQQDTEVIWGWGTPAGRRRAARRGQLVSEAAGLRPAMSVLEIGCGTGLFTEIFSKSGATILAVDISSELLEQARARGLPTDRVEFHCARFEDLADVGPFDAVVGSSILHHLDLGRAIPVIFKALKPGGVMAFAEPNWLNPQVWAERKLPFVRARSHVSPDEGAILRWQFAGRLKRAGFVDVHIRPFDWLHPATPERLIPLVRRVGLVLERLPLMLEFSGSVLIRAKRPSEPLKETRTDVGSA
jgi:SAM-dependent methyltransferase